MIEQLVHKNITEAQAAYSRKLTGRLLNMFDSSQLVAVGGKSSGVKLKSRHFMEHLPSAPLPDGVSAEAATGFTQRLPVVIGDLLFVKNNLLQKEGYVTGIGGCDYAALPGLAITLARDRSSNGVVIRVVQGATEEMPLRNLSYMIPGLILMDQLRQDGMVPPQLQVISAHNISGGLNKLDCGVVCKEARRFSEVAQAYVATFFPELQRYVVFLQDTSFDKGTVLREQLLRIAQAIRFQASSEVSESLKAKAVNNGASRMYRFYAGAHLVIHDANFAEVLEPLIPGVDPVKDPSVIISIGGKQEELFYNLRHEIKPLLGEEYNQITTLQYFTDHRVPPYYMARGGDISIGQVLDGKDPFSASIAAVARHDLYQLYDVSGRRGDLEKFLDLQRRKYG